jgi:hypothetical protein
MEQEFHTRLNWMGRSAIEEALASIGVESFDFETTDVLRETLRDNVLDGTYDKDLLPEWR